MSDLSPEEIRAALAARDRWIILSTIGPDGYPHSVPVGGFLHGDDLVIGCRDGTQKVRNIEREARVSVLWENGRGQPRLQGFMIRGIARVVRDPDQMLELKRAASVARGESPPDKGPPEGTAYLVITATKTVSWNRPSRSS